MAVFFGITGICLYIVDDFADADIGACSHFRVDSYEIVCCVTNGSKAD